MKSFASCLQSLATRTLQTELTQDSSPPTSSERRDLEETLATGDIHFDFNTPLAGLLYTANERKEVTALFCEEPTLIFVGQTNCGKSSIINELLGCKTLPTSDQPSTARIVRVSYAKEPFCRLLAKNGKILKVYVKRSYQFYCF